MWTGRTETFDWFCSAESVVVQWNKFRENIKYGKPNTAIEEIWHALDVAQGKDFVSGLPKGLRF